MAEDLLQTALARTWPHWSRIAGDQPEAYVRKVMVRQQGSWSKRLWRRESATEVLPESSEGASSSGSEGAVDDRDILVRALVSLPVRQRQVVVLRYYEDLSEGEVAQLMGCSPGTVKSQASKGLSKLREAIGSAVDVEREASHD